MHIGRPNFQYFLDMASDGTQKMESKCVQIHQIAEDMLDALCMRQDVYQTSYGPRRVLHLQPMLEIAHRADEVHA